MTLTIPPPVLAFAEYIAPRTVPAVRTTAIELVAKRGGGDLTALIAAYTLFDYLAGHGVPCRVETVAGAGDRYDIGICLRGEWTEWDIKSSAYPFRPDRYLLVNQSVLAKPTYGYIQCFVTPPTMHVSGLVSRRGEVWKKYRDTIVGPPRWRSPCVAIPVAELTPLEELVEYCRNRARAA